jgi:hypothetical protein
VCERERERERERGLIVYHSLTLLIAVHESDYKDASFVDVEAGSCNLDYASLI